MSQPSRVHVVGAGLAGLAAAVRLTEAGVAIILHESAPQAGGRCRSYLDATFGCRIDNGNHLLVSGNAAALHYLAAIGAADTLVGPTEAAYPFVDLATGERWVLRPGAGRSPWWLLDPVRRVPGTAVLDYVKALRLAWAGGEQTVGQVLDPATVLFRRLWQPLAVAALNTGTEEASARLLGCVLAETFAKGGAAYRPLVPREDLSQSFVEPALRHLTSAGAEIRFASRLRDIDFADTHATRLAFEAGEVSLNADEAVILAVPAPVAVRLIPGLTAPSDFRAIVNAHFRLALPETAPLLMGIVGGTAEWVFRKREIVSVTVSAADRLVDMPAEELGVRLWRDVARAFELPLEPMPAVQIVKERRATFAATPAQLKRRPPTATRWANLTLAGDWTETGLPATIEGAIRSGVAAAERLLGAASAEVEKNLSRRRGRAKVAADLPSFH